MDIHDLTLARAVHVAPLLSEVHIVPPLVATAASFVPSSDEVMDCQSFVPSPTVISVHVSPLSLEVHILPDCTVAASFVPSTDELMDFHDFVTPTEVSSVQPLEPVQA